MIIGEYRAAVGRDIYARPTNVVDAVLFIDAAAALGQIDAIHLVMDAVEPYRRMPTCLALDSVLLVAIDVVGLKQTRPVLVGDEARTAVVMDPVVPCARKSHA